LLAFFFSSASLLSWHRSQSMLDVGSRGGDARDSTTVIDANGLESGQTVAGTLWWYLLCQAAEFLAGKETSR
jgi:hypothetical protein